MEESKTANGRQLMQEPLKRLDTKTGAEGELCKRQKAAIRRNGLFVVEKENYQLYYELYGNGEKKVIFVSGLSGTMDDWRRSVLKLLEYNEFEICIFNNRGIRESKCKNWRMTTTMMAHDVARLAEHLHWKKINVCGFSMGGFIVSELVCLHPDIIESAIIAGGTAGFMIPSAFVVGSFAKMIVTFDKKAMLKTMMRTQLSEKFLTTPQKALGGLSGYQYIDQPTSEIFLSEDEPSFKCQAAQVSACLTHHVTVERMEKVKQMKLPILVMHGTADKMVSYSYAPPLAEHLGAILFPFPGCGHGINIEKPELFHECLINFMLGRPLPPAPKDEEAETSSSSSSDSFITV
ncbi:putative Alpha/Beta hydrolase protein [Monocercomonoides exilis]|uniref:putative Alpha/Beta hydrolase protein n=1 Tax=Monocercomonoides exilis TaxID=2049356 RepID=UPI003559A1BA|nr:putative Alpha/Beta hydrolase protein [Monocercomonoides exilis]|eukprot:MONOS_1441.1-p1 / transcript=MONOS_1441.1 / gene=MONOS_1441 / organism=Monocercomonoides_exilis_PA203 / gene_product=hydrolase, alpha / transcript_product=hydrolase, alpha / location=Mono_scaffold00025:192066-193339(-) / protein_length=347 / sequence_SO=supercontig / SO=protein_coding / is_pseudo=false